MADEKDITIVLVRPQYPINLGIIARTMANFGINQLYLVNPLTSPTEGEAIMFSKRAYNILKKAKIVKSIKEAKKGITIGTTASVNRYPNAVKETIPLSKAKEIIKKRPLTLVFGNEGTGLNEEELKECDVILNIETSKTYPSMNISTSVAVILYHIFISQQRDSYYVEADKKLKDTLIKYYEKLVKETKTPEKAVISFKRMLGKTVASKKEIAFMIKVFRRAYNLIKEGKL